MKLNCVILNYNDGDTVKRLLARIHDYPLLSGIVVVDNCSTDDSLAQLRLLEDEKVTVISTEKNGGYGYGNNAGVRYAAEQNQATHVLIANPDVSFSEQCLEKLLRIFKHHPEVAVATPVMHDRQYGNLKNGWQLRGYGKELCSMGPVCRRIFGRFLDYPDSYFEGKRAVYVEAVHGSLLMVDAAKFLEAGGYDEGVFLYQEEAILGFRMKKCGCRTVLLLTESYDHAHSTSISKTYQSLLKRQRLREESELYYMRHYLHVGPARCAFARLWFAVIRAEIRVASALGILK